MATPPCFLNTAVPTLRSDHIDKIAAELSANLTGAADILQPFMFAACELKTFKDTHLKETHEYKVRDGDNEHKAEAVKALQKSVLGMWLSMDDPKVKLVAAMNTVVELMRKVRLLSYPCSLGSFSQVGTSGAHVSCRIGSCRWGGGRREEREERNARSRQYCN
jgi:hypothetical protein